MNDSNAKPSDTFRVFHATLRSKHRKNTRDAVMENSGPGLDERTARFRVAMFRPDMKILSVREVTNEVALCEDCFHPDQPVAPHPATRIEITRDRRGQFGGSRSCEQHEVPDGPHEDIVFRRLVSTGEMTYGAIEALRRKIEQEIDAEEQRAPKKEGTMAR